MERSLGFLPRSALQWLEQHSLPLGSASGGEMATPHLRVAVVKSEVTGHIYTRPGSGRDLQSLVLSSPKMLGPTALLTTFASEFLIVRESKDPECQHWRESFAHDPEPWKSAVIYESHRNLQPIAGPAPHQPQGVSAVTPESVDWSRFDAVFCHDLAVPERIVRQHPRVFWSYWIGETGTPSFKASCQAPLGGYHCFLNGGSRRWRVRPALKSHGVEFPYVFQKLSDHLLLGANPDRPRAGVLLERVTSQTAPPKWRDRLQEVIPVFPTEELTGDRLTRLHSARYFLQMTDQTFWGNGFHEAIMAGCLAIADPRTMPNNRSLCLPELSPRNWPEAVTLIRELEKNPEKRDLLRREQAGRAEWLLFRRPLADWLGKYGEFRKRTGS